MGEAMLVRKGGASFRRLVVIQYPDKMKYLRGQYPDLTGAIIGAQFGTSIVPLHPEAVTLTQRPLTMAQPYISVSMQLGWKTRTLDIPVTVKDISVVLDENDWETIADVSKAGDAAQTWNIGDSKFFTLNGTQIEARIIGFDCDFLDASDAMYANGNYNRGIQKAGITFQFFTCPQQARMAPEGVQQDWSDSEMRTQTLANEFTQLPQDMQSVIRTVRKFFRGSRTNYYHYGWTPDRLFLLNYKEYTGLDIGTNEKDGIGQYPFYADASLLPSGGMTRQYIRTMHYGSGCSVISHFYTIEGNNTVGGGSGHLLNDYYPAFCV